MGHQVRSVADCDHSGSARSHGSTAAASDRVVPEIDHAEGRRLERRQGHKVFETDGHLSLVSSLGPSPCLGIQRLTYDRRRLQGWCLSLRANSVSLVVPSSKASRRSFKKCGPSVRPLPDSLLRTIRSHRYMSTGLKIENAQPSIVHVPREVGPDDVERFFREVVKRQGGPPPQLLLCFLTSKPNPFYAPIKMFGDVVVGCATQCALISKAVTGNAQC